MARLTISGVPEQVMESLRRSATVNGRSINREVLARLENSFRRQPLDPVAFLARVRARRARLSLTGTPLTEEFLDQAINGRASVTVIPKRRSAGSGP